MLALGDVGSSDQFDVLQGWEAVGILLVFDVAFEGVDAVQAAVRVIEPVVGPPAG